MDGRFCLVVNHGIETEGYYNKGGDGGGDDVGNEGNSGNTFGMMVLFAGMGNYKHNRNVLYPQSKFDDMIVHDIAGFYHETPINRDVIVVTAKMEIMKRCYEDVIKKWKEDTCTAMSL